MYGISAPRQENSALDCISLDARLLLNSLGRWYGTFIRNRFVLTDTGTVRLFDVRQKYSETKTYSFSSDEDSASEETVLPQVNLNNFLRKRMYYVTCTLHRHLAAVVHLDGKDTRATLIRSF